jgi:hypothetical protein
MATLAQIKALIRHNQRLMKLKAKLIFKRQAREERKIER